MNYFNSKTAANRYATGRPDFHKNTIEHIRAYLKPDSKFTNALDVACGTGLSTRALLDLALNVYGTDASTEMLKQASSSDTIQYPQANAEEQPFPDDYFDLITVSSGVHWFDIDRFLKEASRILKAKAWLVLYENHFIAEMVGKDNFTNWFLEVYLKHFPSPPRNNDYSWTDENLSRNNFRLGNEEKFRNSISFTRDQLALYFTTQSNIIAAVESGSTTYTEVDHWLHDQLSPFFDQDDQQRTILYGNWIKYIQRSG